MVTSGTHVHASDEKLTDRREKSLPKIWHVYVQCSIICI